ncbi:hypothetical protein EZV62_007338 [Acer yangbiense]|uniref:Uncharacterized protein n=1 Tax=Acer yangbiense TaxID=1000413 RepID=A0A5C7I8Y9_9ROSI|nr:hypothetical protein EZV62_007338 [Acer yangbiense]
MQMTRTWDSTMSMIPKGGDTIWGDLDWSPEGGYMCSAKKLKNNDTAGQNLNQSLAKSKGVNYERMISFGKDVAEAHEVEMGIGGMKAVADYKIYYTTRSILDLLHFVAPKLMARGGAHFSHGIAENLDDLK